MEFYVKLIPAVDSYHSGLDNEVLSNPKERSLFNDWLGVTLQIFALLFFYDPISYFTHRLLHTKKFGRIHQHHHAYIRVTPWSSSCLIRPNRFLTGFHLFYSVLLVPVSSSTIIAFYVLFMFGMANAHGNFSMIGNLSGFAGLQRYFRFHQRHYEFGNVNYGSVGTHWDFVWGRIIEKIATRCCKRSTLFVGARIYAVASKPRRDRAIGQVLL